MRTRVLFFDKYGTDNEYGNQEVYCRGAEGGQRRGPPLTWTDRLRSSKQTGYASPKVGFVEGCRR